jgi:thymidylate synthase
MTQADNQYKRIIETIHRTGTWDKDQQVRTKWDSDGTPAYTKSSIGQFMIFDNTEVPILTTKKVAWKTAIKELLWIWQLKSNNVNILNEMGVKIWDQWKLSDGTIGKSYGHQLGKKCRVHPVTNVYIDQVDYLLYELKHNPSSRRHITSLWNIEDLDEMALNPCVWKTQWFVKENKLHLIVEARSNDIGLGNPFNVFQYNALQRMIAQVTGYELGNYIYQIGDAHYYERHEDKLLEQVNRETFETPELWINPEVTDFYDFSIEDFKLINYKHGEKVTMEVAI